MSKLYKDIKATWKAFSSFDSRLLLNGLKDQYYLLKGLIPFLFYDEYYKKFKNWLQSSLRVMAFFLASFYFLKDLISFKRKKSFKSYCVNTLKKLNSLLSKDSYSIPFIDNIIRNLLLFIVALCLLAFLLVKLIIDCMSDIKNIFKNIFSFLALKKSLPQKLNLLQTIFLFRRLCLLGAKKIRSFWREKIFFNTAALPTVNRKKLNQMLQNQDYHAIMSALLKIFENHPRLELLLNKMINDPNDVSFNEQIELLNIMLFCMNKLAKSNEEVEEFKTFEFFSHLLIISCLGDEYDESNLTHQQLIHTFRAFLNIFKKTQHALSRETYIDRIRESFIHDYAEETGNDLYRLYRTIISDEMETLLKKNHVFSQSIISRLLALSLASTYGFNQKTFNELEHLCHKLLSSELLKGLRTLCLMKPHECVQESRKSSQIIKLGQRRLIPEAITTIICHELEIEKNTSTQDALQSLVIEILKQQNYQFLEDDLANMIDGLLRKDFILLHKLTLHDRGHIGKTLLKRPYRDVFIEEVIKHLTRKKLCLQPHQKILRRIFTSLLNQEILSCAVLIQPYLIQNWISLLTSQGADNFQEALKESGYVISALCSNIFGDYVSRYAFMCAEEIEEQQYPSIEADYISQKSHFEQLINIFFFSKAPDHHTFLRLDLLDYAHHIQAPRQSRISATSIERLFKKILSELKQHTRIRIGILLDICLPSSTEEEVFHKAQLEEFLTNFCVKITPNLAKKYNLLGFFTSPNEPISALKCLPWDDILSEETIQAAHQTQILQISAGLIEYQLDLSVDCLFKWWRHLATYYSHEDILSILVMIEDQDYKKVAQFVKTQTKDFLSQDLILLKPIVKYLRAQLIKQLGTYIHFEKDYHQILVESIPCFIPQPTGLESEGISPPAPLQESIQMTSHGDHQITRNTLSPNFSKEKNVINNYFAHVADNLIAKGADLFELLRTNRKKDLLTTLIHSFEETSELIEHNYYQLRLNLDRWNNLYNPQKKLIEFLANLFLGVSPASKKFRKKIESVLNLTEASKDSPPLYDPLYQSLSFTAWFIKDELSKRRDMMDLSSSSIAAFFCKDTLALDSLNEIKIIDILEFLKDPRLIKSFHSGLQEGLLFIINTTDAPHAEYLLNILFKIKSNWIPYGETIYKSLPQDRQHLTPESIGELLEIAPIPFNQEERNQLRILTEGGWWQSARTGARLLIHSQNKLTQALSRGAYVLAKEKNPITSLTHSHVLQTTSVTIKSLMFSEHPYATLIRQSCYIAITATTLPKLFRL